MRLKKATGAFGGSFEGDVAENRGFESWPALAWFVSVAGSADGGGCGVKLKIGLGGLGCENCWNKGGVGVLSETAVRN